MTIKDLYEKVNGLPDLVNIELADDTHPWIGEYKDLPPKYSDVEFVKAYIHSHSDKPCVTFHIIEKEIFDGRN